MEALRIEEIELFGEEGGRVFVSPDVWAKDPDRAGIALRLVGGAGRAMIRLDDEETHQLRAMIEAQVPARKFGDKGIKFFGPRGTVLRFVPSNMGEPYREGFEISYGVDNGDWIDPEVSVFLQDREMTDLGEAIDKFTKPEHPHPQPR